MQKHCYQYLRSSSKDVSHPDPNITICLNKDGLFVDGKEGNASEGGYCGWSKNNNDYKNLINTLNNTSSIQIGQMEGSNRSTSTYHFIRVIREREVTE